MSQIKKNLEQIRDRINSAARRAGRDPDGVRLVAVSKKIPAADLNEAYACGQKIFGENYLQEAAAKIEQLDAGISWHFIGHLQSNKAALAANLFAMVETVDSLKVARALERSLAAGATKVLPVLLQVNIGRESQKAGVLPEDAAGLLREIQMLPHLRVRGVMVMPPFSVEPEEVRPYFRQARELTGALGDQGLLAAEGGIELSMGMSGDYEAAIEEGATLVRIGTALFGNRL